MGNGMRVFDGVEGKKTEYRCHYGCLGIINGKIFY